MSETKDEAQTADPPDERQAFDLSKPLLHRPHNRAAKNPDGSDKTHHQWLVDVLWGTGGVRNGILADRIERQQAANVRLWQKDVTQIAELMETLNIPWVAFALLQIFAPEKLKE